jgi:hypothetical protein
MTFEEAGKIYKDWVSFIEIADKLYKIFTHIPESFLPYPVEILEEALNIIAKDYFDAGDKKTSQNIQETMAYHLTPFYITPSGPLKTKINNNEALDLMKRDLNFICENPELKDAKLKGLRECQESWLKVNIKRNKLTELFQ